MKATTALLAIFTLLFVGVSSSGHIASLNLTRDSVTSPSSRPAIPSRFTSFSVEWDIIQEFFGAHGGAKYRPSMANLLLNLKELTGIAPIIRIGGLSADYSWWNPKGLKFPTPFIWYSITPKDHEALKSISEFTGSKLILGLNFVNSTNPKFAVDHLYAINNEIGFQNIEAFEIGNEVDYNARRTGVYTPARFKKEWNMYTDSLVATGKLPTRKYFQGATYAGKPLFMRDLHNLYKEEAKTSKEFSIHTYPLTACGGNNPNLEQLMEYSACQGRVDSLAVYAQKALQEGTTLSMGETNSVSCSGKSGISNTFGAALWALDWMTTYASANFTGTNFHSHKNAPYNFVAFDPTGDIPKVQPLYYALYFWSHFAGKGFTISPTYYISSNIYLRSWCLKDTTNGDLRCLLINKDINAKIPTTLSFGWKSKDLEGYESDTIEFMEMTAPNAHGSDGIVAAGVTFEGSKDGKPIGKIITKKMVSTKSGDSVTFTPLLKPASATIFIIKKKTA